MGKEGRGNEAEQLFIDWLRRITDFFKDGTNVIDLRDVKNYRNMADIDFVITDASGNEPVFHEAKEFEHGLEDGNIYLEQIKNSTHLLRFGEVVNAKRPENGIAVQYMPEEISYQNGVGWLYKNTAFRPDYYHFYLPYKLSETSCTEKKKRDFVDRIQLAKKPAKLITKAPTGIWISMEYATVTNLNSLAKNDELYANAQDRTNLKKKPTYLLLNFSTALVMRAIYDKQKMFFKLNGTHAQMGFGAAAVAKAAPEDKIPVTYFRKLQLRPVVKCITPDNPDNEIIEVMETAVTDYYIPEELLEKCREPEAYKLYTDEYPSQYSCQKWAGDMKDALIKVLEQAQPL